MIGIGAFISYLGLAYVNEWGSKPWWLAIFIVGIAVTLLAFFMWIREDVKMWPETWVPHPHKDVSWYGMVYFLCTEVVVFGSLFAVYFYRKEAFDPQFYSQAFWSGKFALAAINTAILVASSFTLHYAHNAIIKNNHRGLVIGTAITLLLGTIFLGIQMYEYSHLFHDGFTMQQGIYGSIFFTLTGIHGFHVFLGLVFLAIVLVRAMKGQFSSEKHVAVEGFSLYWHFVDVVWIGLFVALYVLPFMGW